MGARASTGPGLQMMSRQALRRIERESNAGPVAAPGRASATGQDMGAV